MTNKGGGILNRYMIILEAIAASEGGLTLTELVQRTELSKGTVHRLVSSLIKSDVIMPRDGRKIYILAPRFQRLLYMSNAGNSVSTYSQPILQTLTTHFNQTVFVAQLFEFEVRSVAMAFPNSADQAYIQPGRVMPTHAAASAKAIWAFQDESKIELVLKNERLKFSKHTIVEEDNVRVEFERVRKRGYAICNQEMGNGLLSYACPIDIEGPGVIFSITVVGTVPALRKLSRTNIVSSLREATQEFARSYPASLGKITDIQR